MRKIHFLSILSFFIFVSNSWGQLSINDFNVNHTITFDATLAGVNHGSLLLNNAPTNPTSSGDLNSNAWSLTPNSNFQGRSNGTVTTGGWYAFLVNTGNRALGAQPSGSFINHNFKLTAENNTGETITDLAVTFKLYAGAPEGRNATINYELSSGTNRSGSETTDNILSNGTATIGTWKYIEKTLNITNLNILPHATFTLTVSSNRGTGSGASDEWAIDDIAFKAISDFPIFNTVPLGLTGLSYSGTGPSAIQSFALTGSDLTPASGQITLTPPVSFEISTSPSGPFVSTPVNLSYNSSSYSGTIYVRAKSGLEPRVYNENLIISGGGANDLLVNMRGTIDAGPCGDLLISEYVEGSSFNKYLEIYNPTNQTIVLNDNGADIYRVALYNNGNTSPNKIITFPTNASIPSGGTYVVAHSSATIFSGGIDYSTSSLDYNGNDAFSIQRNVSGWRHVDIFGRIGSDPGNGGWTAGGGYATTDKTLIRKPHVNQGIRTNPSAANGFQTLASEWMVYDTDEHHTLGFHISECKTSRHTNVQQLNFFRYCNQDSLVVTVDATGSYPTGTSFSIEISDDQGSFASPTVIGTYTTSSPLSNTSVLIPTALPADFDTKHYHIRANSSASNTEMNISQRLSVEHIDLPFQNYFISKQSGDWLDFSTWLVSVDSLYWEDACSYPTHPISLSTKILSGHDVSLNNPIDISHLEILEGGKITHNTGSLNIQKSEHEIDFMVYGTFEDQGASGNGIGFSDDSKWLLGENGTIIKTRNSSINNYRDNYYGGIENIPSTAHWILRKTTSTNPNTSAVNMYYPNLYIENDHTNAATIDFTGLAGYTTIKGDFVLRGNNTVNVRYQNTNPQPLTILGDLVIKDNNNTIRTYVNATSNIGTGIQVYGNIINDGAIVLNHDATYLKLSGNKTQSISGNGTFNIHHLKVNKTPQSIVNLTTDLEVKTQLAFDGGTIQAENNTLYVSNTHPTQAIIGHDEPNGTGVYSNDNYVIGQLKRKMGTSHSTYVFPVGVSTIGYNPARISVKNVPSANAAATGQFIHSDPGKISVYRTFDCDGDTKFLDYQQLTNEGYWKFDSEQNFVDYTINLHPNEDNLNIYPNNEALSAGYTGTYRALKEENHKAGDAWNPDVSVAGEPCIVSDNYYDIIGAGYTGFSIFAPGGGDQLSTALPVELLYFNLNCEQSPTLEWATASELNSDYFTIEKSNDAKSFQVLTGIKAGGTTHHLKEYEYTLNSHEQYAYYRLSQTDLDGTVTYYSIVDNPCRMSQNQTHQVFYAPNQGITLNLKHDNKPHAIYIFDATGRLIGENNQPNIDSNQILGSAHSWNKGVYLVQLLLENQTVETHKVLVY